MGYLSASIFAKHNYSLILVDSSLDKLNKLRESLGRVFPHMTDDRGDPAERI